MATEANIFKEILKRFLYAAPLQISVLFIQIGQSGSSEKAYLSTYRGFFVKPQVKRSPCTDQILPKQGKRKKLVSSRAANQKHDYVGKPISAPNERRALAKKVNYNLLFSKVSASTAEVVRLPITQ